MSDKLINLGFGITKNERQVDRLPLKGKLPDWLHGTLIRNGPGTLQMGGESFRHWFDGLAMLHKFTFQDSNVSYANKFLDTKSYRSAVSAGKIVFSEFATDPQWSITDRVKNFLSPKITDSAKVNLTRIGDHYMAMAETPIQVIFDPKTLETKDTFSYEKNLVGQLTTVHPQYDPHTNRFYNLVTRFHQTSHYRIYELGNDLNPRQITSVPVKKPAYMHSFGMSENYFILTEFPLVVNSLALLFWLKPFIENYHWKPDRGTKITLINRHNGQVESRFTTDSFFAFHHINAFEEGKTLTIDLAVYEDSSILKSFYLDTIKADASPLPYGRLTRLQLPINGGKVTSETLSETCMELPNYDVTRLGNAPEYRYIYAVSVNPQTEASFYNQIAKVDIQGKKDHAWYQPCCYPGEPIFIGRPGREKEDDGIILSVVLDVEKETSFLLVLDAESFNELARAEIPHPILMGYHGAYFKDLI
jgi:beta,beta-carotene 9',10'-dioxygenase